MAADIDAPSDYRFWETFSLYLGRERQGALGPAVARRAPFEAWEDSYWDDLRRLLELQHARSLRARRRRRPAGSSYQRSTMLPTKYMALVLRLIPQTAAYWPGQHETVITDYADRVVAAGALTIPDTCATKQGTYGVNYGPNGAGGCIRGSGRVPQYNGTTVDGAVRGRGGASSATRCGTAYR